MFAQLRNSMREEAMSTVMRARNLSKWYGKHEAVRDVSLDIEPGALTAVIGPNGAGKSTTISMLTGLAKPDGGVIEYGAQSQSHAHAPRLGVVFQGSVLDPTLTVRENLSIRARLYPGTPRGRVDEVIALVGAESFAGQQYGSLSGGQRRSIDIARALINRPELLILDEPTTGLDIATRRTLWTMLDGLRKRENLSILLTTHYLEEANYAQQVYLIDHGVIHAQGSAQELIQRYTQYTLDITFSPERRQEIEQIAQDYVARAQRFDDADGASASATSTAASQPDMTAGNATQATTAVATIDGNHLHLSVSSADECIGLLTAMRPYILDFRCLRGTMNDVFLTLTGHNENGTIDADQITTPNPTSATTSKESRS
jgi:multidrug/hemolysin transport system ATP-binding protein